MGCGGSTSAAPDPTYQQEYPQTNTSPTHRSTTSRNTGYNNNTQNKNNNINNKENKPARRPRPYPESKYAASNGSATTPDPCDVKGYKRRIRARLVEATSGKDMQELEKSMLVFESNNVEDCGEMSRAYERLEYLRTKRDLRDAIRRSNVGVLEKTIADARASPYAPRLANQIDAAERKLAHLRELNEYSHDILAMDQSTISEIHSYHRPPTCVHDVMAASHMLLGYNESKLRDWSYLQGLMGRVGRDSLIHQVQDFDTAGVEQRTAGRVREILGYHDLKEVRAASNGAAAFHVWASNVVDKMGRDQTSEEPVSVQSPTDTPVAATPKSNKGSRR